jgi:hypothetical protein
MPLDRIDRGDEDDEMDDDAVLINLDHKKVVAFG